MWRLYEQLGCCLLEAPVTSVGPVAPSSVERMCKEYQTQQGPSWHQNGQNADSIWIFIDLISRPFLRTTLQYMFNTAKGKNLTFYFMRGCWKRLLIASFFHIMLQWLYSFVCKDVIKQWCTMAATRMIPMLKAACCRPVNRHNRTTALHPCICGNIFT